MKIAYLFPGQGSQAVGMCYELFKEHALVRDTFDEADDLYGEKLSSMCFFGPEEALKQTIVTQPALYVTSVAILRVLQHSGATDPFAVAGHSIGEYAALTAAGVLDFETGFHLVMRRAQEMQRAASTHPGTMAAVVGISAEAADECCREISTTEAIVEAANFNSPSQVVISGSSLGIERATAALKLRGARKVIPLSVSGAFHSSLMKPAADAMVPVLEHAQLKPPNKIVIANRTADIENEVSEIKHNLASQIDHPVRWEQSILKLSTLGCTHYAEVGPGSILSGLNKRILEVHTTVAAGDMEGVNNVLAFGGE